MRTPIVDCKSSSNDVVLSRLNTAYRWLLLRDIWLKMTKYDKNIGQTQSAEKPLQMLVGPITRARTKKFQEALNEPMKEFIWANPTLQEEFGPIQTF